HDAERRILRERDPVMQSTDGRISAEPPRVKASELLHLITNVIAVRDERGGFGVAGGAGSDLVFHGAGAGQLPCLRLQVTGLQVKGGIGAGSRIVPFHAETQGRRGAACSSWIPGAARSG